jgi:uncharacterized protein (TIGR03435 family)
MVMAQTEAPLAFEVASVKQNKRFSWVRRPWSPNIDCGPIAQCGISGSRFTDDFASLMDLIIDAYSVKSFQIAGLPDWGDSGHDVYDVEATVEGDKPPTLDQARRMLQTLLADRFRLKLHHETRELPVYALVVARNGPKLTPTAESCLRGTVRLSPDPGDRGRIGLLELWALMPERLAPLAGRPVIDKTGLKAAAYCTLDGQDPFFVVRSQVSGGGRGRGGEAAASADPGGASIFTLVEEKWGLKLEAQKGPVDVLVIDHVERPSEN